MWEKTWGDFIDMGLDLLFTALLISGITMCAMLSNQYNEKSLENQAISQEFSEQRNNLFYNHTHVYQQDIVALVLKYKGEREVRVTLTNGSSYDWSTDTQSSDYKVSDISNILPKDILYDADLIYGPNLYDVVGYQFAEHKDGCGRS